VRSFDFEAARTAVYRSSNDNPPAWNIMKTILLIDDDPATLEVINESLRPHFRTRIATRGGKGLELARLSPAPDLVLLDLELPDMNGYQVCSALKRDVATADIPVIFLSSHSDIADITRGLELGAVDYVPKPVAPPILLARVRTQLRLREAQIHLADRNLHLESLVHERTRDLEARTLDLQRNQELTIVALGAVAETRDNETGNHIHRTRAYVEHAGRKPVAAARAAGSHAAEEWALIWKCAPLHDIGKVGIPDQILLKPGKLDAERVRNHEAAHDARPRRAAHAPNCVSMRTTPSCASPRKSFIRITSAGTARAIRRASAARHSASRTADGDRRRLRRPDQQACVQSRPSARRCGGHHPPGARRALRPADRRLLPGLLRRVRGDRRAATPTCRRTHETIMPMCYYRWPPGMISR
jgi:DNA-binding response OmpR family regulator